MNHAEPVSDAASNIARRGGNAPTRWDRLTNDRYFTIEANWIIPALLSKVKITGPILEPAAGVGHMVRELRRGHGLEVIANDLHAYEDPLLPDIGIADIRAIDSLKGFRWVVTNLPFDQQTELGAHLVQLGARDGCSVALLTRSEWLIARARASSRRLALHCRRRRTRQRSAGAPMAVFLNLTFLNLYPDRASYTEAQYAEWLAAAGRGAHKRLLLASGGGLLCAQKLA